VTVGLTVAVAVAVVNQSLRHTN